MLSVPLLSCAMKIVVRQNVILLSVIMPNVVALVDVGMPFLAGNKMLPVRSWLKSVFDNETCYMFYKHITIVNDASRFVRIMIVGHGSTKYQSAKCFSTRTPVAFI